MLRSSSSRIIYSTLKQLNRASSAATPAIPSEKRGTSDENAVTSPAEEIQSSKLRLQEVKKRRSYMVAAAFASLKQPIAKPSKTIDQKILDCKTPEHLLTLSQNTFLNRKQALKIVTTLAEWSVNGICDMSTIETDERFVSLCHLLGKSSIEKPSLVSPKNTYNEQHDNLSMLISVTSEEEALKVTSTLPLPRIIKLLTSLASQKKRSSLLLRSLAISITNSNDEINIKKFSDILFALASLNYPDEILLGKISNNLIKQIPLCENPSVIGSISTSLGRLRYRNDALLECLSEWIMNNLTLCRRQEFVSILITLGAVNYIPSMKNKFFDAITEQLCIDDMPHAFTWLDVIWALVVLEKANSEHYKSVLTQHFVDRMITSQPESANSIWRKKLLNINGSAVLNEDYKGPTLEDYKDLNAIPLVRTKEKQQLVTSVLDTFSNILPSSAYLRKNVDLGMGFIIDGECQIDGKMTPYPLVDKVSGQTIRSGKGQKIAIMCWNYQDKTRGTVGLSGANTLCVKLLQQSGYRVLSVYNNEYNSDDKLFKRVEFLENCLKRTIRPSS